MSKNRIKQAIALLLALVLIVGGIAFDPAPAVAATDKNIKVGDAYYTILPANNKTVEYVKPATKTCTAASIPDTVKISGKTYQVTSIGANAFKGCTKLKLVTVGYYVKKIGKKSFYGCKALKDIIIHTEKLASANIGTDAFKGINNKAVVAVPKAKLSSYRKALKAKGVAGKKQKVKENKYINEFDPKEPQFAIGDLTGMTNGTPTRFEFANPRTKIGIKKTNQYFVGDTIKLESQFCLLPGIYGHWENDPRELTKNISCCNTCKKYFTATTLGMHDYTGMWLDHSLVCGISNTIFSANGKHLKSYVFVPDPDPCKTVISFTLPEGLSCSEKDVKVANKRCKIDLTSACKISVSGSKVTITIDDVKQEPFYKRFNYEAYMKDMHYQRPAAGNGEPDENYRHAITITVDAKVGSNVGTDNTIKNSMTYYYKGASHTEDFELSFHTASMKIAANTDTDGNSLEGAEFDLYRTVTTYDENNMGVGDWSLFASGLHVGDVVNGLGTGIQANVDGQYRLVQTKAPDGYRQAQPFDFTLTIDTKGNTKITAVDDDDNKLPVENGTVMVTFVNYGKPSSKSGNTSTDTPSTGGGTGGTTGGNSSGSTGAGGNQSSTGNVEKKAVATYYKDGVRQFWYTHGTEEFDSNGMMSTASVSSYATAFEGCRLEKITVNGETVDTLPAKVPYGTEIGFWYVSN